MNEGKTKSHANWMVGGQIIFSFNFQAILSRTLVSISLRRLNLEECFTQRMLLNKEIENPEKWHELERQKWTYISKETFVFVWIEGIILWTLRKHHHFLPELIQILLNKFKRNINAIQTRDQGQAKFLSRGPTD